VVRVVALMLAVLRRDEAVDRQVRRPLHHLLGPALGRRCVAELRLAGGKNHQMAVVGAVRPKPYAVRLADGEVREIEALNFLPCPGDVGLIHIKATRPISAEIFIALAV